MRHYTYGGDLARGIRLCVEHAEALNEDFNLSTAGSTTVLELADWSGKGQWRPAVPGRQRRALRVRRPAPHTRHRQGGAGTGFQRRVVPVGESVREVVAWVAPN